MNFQELQNIIVPVLGHPLDPIEQIPVIKQTKGPLWVVAGPGSGKTEVLVVRALKLLFVDNVNPKSIIVTTFTEKAAKNLFDRILNYANYIFQAHPDLQTKIDIHSLRVDTLHGLCNDIMLEYRYPDYENFRLLDDLEQYLFISEHSGLVRDNTATYLAVWQHFEYLVQGWDPITSSTGWNDTTRPPNRWRRQRAAVSIFNRIAEDMVDVSKMKAQGGLWSLLADAYRDYVTSLEQHKRCDFAQVQKKFLDFLATPLGSLFLNGDGSPTHPELTHVMVDEYQDTNSIQEAIYLRLMGHRHNLCVVGDDDQALYRFRGGTVDCMVTFDRACSREWHIPITKITKKFLSANYRSHPDIVSYCDFYINSFPSMNLAGARVAAKPSLSSVGGIGGNYPAVAYISGSTLAITAANFASFVGDLLGNGIIQSPSQCVLLMRSVRESPYNAGPFTSALRHIGVRPYNPRSRTFLQQEEITGVLGAFISVVDPNLAALPAIPGISNMVASWINAFQQLTPTNPLLSKYVTRSQQEISKAPLNSWLGVNIQEIIYRILAHEPFKSWDNDPERSHRFGKLTSMFELYASVPYPNFPGSNRGNLRSSSSAAGEISFGWRQNFYYSLVGLLVSEGISDPEDEEIICPPDELPVMTVHQVKGLEFPFVFVYGLRQTPPSVDASIRLEEDLSVHKHTPPLLNFTQAQRAEHDLIRFFYVAYSRAQYALIHIVPSAHLPSSVDGFGFPAQDTNVFKTFIPRV